MPNRSFLKKVIAFFSSPAVIFWSLAWLMVLLVVGTIAERYIGLYQAQNRFFSSFFFWSGWIPLPGAYTVLGIVFVGLFIKLVFRSKWRRENIGTIVTHFGALALLFGGFLTAAFSHEGGMVLREGATVGFISDYNNVELAVVPHGPSGDAPAVVFGKKQLASGAVLESRALPFRIRLMQYSRNSTMERRAAPLPPDKGYHGFASIFALMPAPLEKENDQNQAGATFRLEGAGSGADGTYSIFENMPIEQTVTAGGKKFGLVLRRVQTPLPFKIHLVKFTKTVHPGTDIPASYQSEVRLLDGGVDQRVLIWMNHPLHYKGYTLYQASFMNNTDDSGPQTSILAVVHNIGRVFPYISSLIMCIGLLLHLMLQIPRLLQNRVKREKA